MEEAALILKVHKNTIRAWLKSGLEPIDDRRPIVILGRHLAGFLHARRKHRRQRCGVGQFYCMRCRAPKPPAAQVAEYRPITPSSGNLGGTCADCGSRMCRRVALAKLATVAGDLEVVLPQAQERIEDTTKPSLNSDFSHEAKTHANAQSGK